MRQMGRIFDIGLLRAFGAFAGYLVRSAGCTAG